MMLWDRKWMCWLSARLRHVTCRNWWNWEFSARPGSGGMRDTGCLILCDRRDILRLLNARCLR